MKTTYIQSMLAINADRITDIEIAIGFQRDQAALFKVQGETAFKEDAYRQIGHLQRKLAKAVDMQRGIKAELMATFAEARLPGKVDKLLQNGFTYNIDAGLTSFENERRLDAAIASLVPKKADSRTPEQIAALEAVVLARNLAKAEAKAKAAAEKLAASAE